MSTFITHAAIRYIGDHLAKLREPGMRMEPVVPGKRFCESCQMQKVRNGYAQKGWRCLDCEAKKNEPISQNPVP